MVSPWEIFKDSCSAVQNLAHFAQQFGLSSQGMFARIKTLSIAPFVLVLISATFMVEQERLSAEIAGIDDADIKLFKEDPSSFTDYAKEIACPMYLQLLQARLGKCYYRTIDVRRPHYV